MQSKEDFYLLVKRLRKIAADPKYRACSCPKTACEWNGDCIACVAIHRYHGDHVPNCFQQIINEKLKVVAAIGEMDAIEKEKTPAEYWEYVRKNDAETPQGKDNR